MNGGLKLAQVSSAASEAVSIPVSMNDRSDEEITIRIIVSRMRRNAPLPDPDGEPCAAIIEGASREWVRTSEKERAVRSRTLTVDLRTPAANDHFEEVEHASPELVAIGAELLIATPIATAAAQPDAALSSGDEELVFRIEELEIDLDDSGILSIQTESLLPLSWAVTSQSSCAADEEIELDASDVLEMDNAEALENPRTRLRRAA